MPGVVAVYTGRDVAADKVGGLICGWTVKDKKGEPHKAPRHDIIAIDHVRHVGDQVAVVIADTYAHARDAAEAIDVDYDVLKPVVDVVTEIGRAHVRTPVPNAHIVCRLQLEKNNTT